MLIPYILSVSLLTIMAPTAVSPALAAICDAFPSISQTQAKLVLTLPTLVMMPIGLFSARLTARIDKKKLFSDANPEACRLRFVVSAITTVVIGFMVLGFTYTLPKKALEG